LAFHRVVWDNGRIYDKMTGPNGMTIEEYSELFEDWEWVNLRPVEEE